MTNSSLSQAQLLGLDPSALQQTEEGFWLLPDVCQAFNAMQQAALADGINLHIVSSYRNFERQLFIWQQKWQGLRPLYHIDGQPLAVDALTDEQKLHAILTWSALPGASRHHWGCDFDVWDKLNCLAMEHKFELVQEEYQTGGPCHVLYCWLQQHAQRFDFYFPYQSYVGGVAPEPWHLSYYPISRKLLLDYDPESLRQLLHKTDIGGKTLILEKLDALLERYFYSLAPFNIA